MDDRWMDKGMETQMERGLSSAPDVKSIEVSVDKGCLGDVPVVV